jgi:hypothetical protein
MWKEEGAMPILILLAQLQGLWCFQSLQSSDLDCRYNSSNECHASNVGRQGLCVPNPRRKPPPKGYPAPPAKAGLG